MARQKQSSFNITSNSNRILNSNAKKVEIVNKQATVPYRSLAYRNSQVLNCKFRGSFKIYEVKQYRCMEAIPMRGLIPRRGLANSQYT